MTAPTTPVRPAGDMAEPVRLVRAWISVVDDGDGGAEVPLGGGRFDVVMTAAGDAGHATVATLDAWQEPYGCGPVIADCGGPWLYWLVPPGTGSRWEPHPYAVCFGAPATITVPPLERTTPPARGGYWLRPCHSSHLVGPLTLRRALDLHRPLPAPHTAAGALLGAAPLPPPVTGGSLA